MIANRIIWCIQITNIDIVIVFVVFIDDVGIGCGRDGGAGRYRIRGATARLLSFISKFNHISRSTWTLRRMIKQNKLLHLTHRRGVGNCECVCVNRE